MAYPLQYFLQIVFLLFSVMVDFLLSDSPSLTSPPILYVVLMCLFGLLYPSFLWEETSEKWDKFEIKICYEVAIT